MANTLKLGAGKWATGTDTVLAFNDENNNIKPLPFSFSRASSATIVNQSGLIETVGSGTPRIDFLGNTKGALKLEPTRTNFLIQSNNFNTSWSKTLATITSDEIASPISGEMADSILATATSGGHRVLQAPSTTGVGTFTMYIKQKELSRICVHFLGANKAAGFDCSDNTTFAATGIASYPTRYNISNFGNGWSKVEMYDVGTTTRVDIYIANPTDGGNNAVWTGDGTSKIYLSASQLEIGSYATSYIPTSGSAVTRVAETCSQTPPSGVIGQTEGTMFAEFEIGEDNSHFFLYTNTSNAIYIQTKIGDVWRAYVINGGVYQVAITTGSVPSSGFVKMAFAYKENDFVLYANGNLIGADTSGSVPTCDTYDLGLGPYGTGYSPKRTKETTLYNTRLTNAELAALTQV